MKVASWNVNSVRTRIDNILEWIKKENPDILCLQEIKVVTESFPREPFEDLGYNLIINGQKSYNGVATLSKFLIEESITKIPNFDDDQAFDAVANGDGSYSLSTGTPIDFVDFLGTEDDLAPNLLGTVEQPRPEPNIVFETYWEDGGGFKIEGSKVFLKDDCHFNLDWRNNGGPYLVSASSGTGWALGSGDDPFELAIKVSGDETIGYTGIDVLD